MARCAPGFPCEYDRYYDFRSGYAGAQAPDSPSKASTYVNALIDERSESLQQGELRPCSRLKKAKCMACAVAHRP